MPFKNSKMSVVSKATLNMDTGASYESRMSGISNVSSGSGGSYFTRMSAISHNMLESGSSYYSRLDTFNTPSTRREEQEAVDLIFGNTGFEVSADTTVYVGTVVDQYRSRVEIPMPTVTAVELYVSCSVAPGSSNSNTYTVMKDGVATSLTATISGSDTVASITAQTVDFTAQSKFSVKIVTGAGAAVAHHTFAVKITSTEGT